MNDRYPLSPELRAFVDKTLSLASTASDYPGHRAAYTRMSQAFDVPRPAGLEVTDFQLADVPVRLYRPAHLPAETAAPCVIYLHGGGWIVGGLDSHDFITAALAVDVRCVVIAVDYRLAPEHPFPAPFEDCVAVWHAVQAQADWLGIDASRVAVAGDSAGGNLAAALCLALRDGGYPQPKGQALIYPALGSEEDLPSRSACADAPLLSSAEMDDCWALYLSRPEDFQSPYAMPLLADDFSGLAPAFIGVAQFDPLHDDGVAYEQRLRKAGVSTVFDAGEGLVHGYLRAKGLAVEADQSYERLINALRRMIL
ncbi:lipase [Pseudomonas sp. S25]|uniref:Lipase n=1 Tax=Pseudomonas maioricensis TaxID=1766623 RepID=A0ABS9ZFG6_9PSED|nr:alpha/beta hydrolase [Pseudomonas sp. S25]MCI8209157.1 lipase [Pseudomonas sp. S25]